MDKYFIKDGYKCGTKNTTFSEEKSGSYWDKERIFFSQYYQYHVYKLARRIIKSNKEINSVVDIGCGAGIKLVKLIHPVCPNITGIDQASAINFCNNFHKKGKFIIDNIERPEVDLPKYDLIISSDVIEHLLDPDNLLNYIKNLARAQTLIIISTPDRDILRGANCMSSPKPEHVREWNRREFKMYLEDRGFEILQHLRAPFMKFSLHPKVYLTYRAIIKKTKTRLTNQIVVCKIKNI